MWNGYIIPQPVTITIFRLLLCTNIYTSCTASREKPQGLTCNRCYEVAGHDLNWDRLTFLF